MYVGTCKKTDSAACQFHELLLTKCMDRAYLLMEHVKAYKENKRIKI